MCERKKETRETKASSHVSLERLSISLCPVSPLLPFDFCAGSSFEFSSFLSFLCVSPSVFAPSLPTVFHKGPPLSFLFSSLLLSFSLNEVARLSSCVEKSPFRLLSCAVCLLHGVSSFFRSTESRLPRLLFPACPFLSSSASPFRSSSACLFLSFSPCRQAQKEARRPSQAPRPMRR